MNQTVFLIQLAATLVLVGLIWTIQITQYPLFDGVGEDSFTAYHARYSTAISRLVIPLMLAELVTAIAWLVARPVFVPSWLAWTSAALVGVVWLSTFLLQVPQHGVLGAGFDANAHRILVTTNWIRTLAWTARGGLLLYLVSRLKLD